MTNSKINLTKCIKDKILFSMLINLFLNLFLFVSGLFSQNAYYEEGLKYANSENYDSSIIYYTLSIESDPEFAEAFYERACSYTRQQNLENALCDVNEYLKRCPQSVSGYVLRGIIYEFLNRFTEAIEDYKIGIDSNYTFLFFGLGKCYYEIGNLDLALNAFDSAIYYGKDIAKSYYYKGLCYLEKNNNDSACINLGYSTEEGNYFAERLMCEYCDSSQIKKSVTISYLLDGLLYMKKENYDVAIVKFLTALDVTNNFPDALYLIGRCYYYKGDYDNAVKYITQAISISPLDEYYVYRGISYYKLMQDSKIKNSYKKQMMYRLYAINDFKTYVGKDTSYYYGYSYLGWIYFYDYYDMEKSFIMFKKAIKLERDDVDVMVGLLLSSYCLGEEENTKKYYENICQFEPDFRGNKKGLEYLEKEREYSH